MDWHGLPQGGYGGPIALTLQQGNFSGTLQGSAVVAPYAIELTHAQLRSARLARPMQIAFSVHLPKVLHGDYATEGKLSDMAWVGMPEALGKSGIQADWHASGTDSRYQGSLTLESGENRLHADVAGLQKSMTLLLRGNLLGGQLLRSKVEASFGSTESVQGTLALRRIPLQAVFKRVPGHLSADITLRAAASSPVWTGNIRWNLLPSQIYQEPLNGSGELQFSGNTWDLKQAVLTGPGLRLAAEGSLAQRLTIDAQVDHWSGILPTASGMTKLHGWIAQREQKWQGELHLQGKQLRYQKVALARLNLDGSLGAGDKLQAALQATGITLNGQKVNMRSNVSGSLQEANVQLSLQDDQRSLDLGGTLQHAVAWKFDLAELRFQDPRLGRWSLVQPAVLQWSQGNISIATLRIDGANGASIRVAGNYTIGSSQGNIDAEATALPLDFWDKALDSGIRGRWNAQIQGRCAGTCQIRADWGVRDTVLHWVAGDTSHHVAITQFSGNLHWQKDGLHVQSNLRLADQLGTFQLDANSPAVLQLPWKAPTQQPLHATVTGHVPGLLLSQLPTGNIDVDPKGDITINLRAAGTWGKPLWQGQANASGLGCYIPEAGLHLEDIAAQLTGSGDHLLLKNLTVHSGSGTLHGSGEVVFSKDLPYQIHITGNNFLALNLPQVQAAIDPDIDIHHGQGKLTINGKVETTRLRILGTDFGGPKPSSDVVFVHGAQQSNTPSNLAVDVRIGLGKNARVLIGGLHADLRGDLQLRMVPPSTTPLLQGNLQMVDGKYEIYGNSLTFERGKILFNGPPQAASLDVLAVRRIKNSDSFAVNNETIVAGVRVTGNLSHPVVSLYSKPSMAQNDILSYLVLGTPSTGLQSQDAVLSAAAGQLFSAGRAAVFGNSLSSTGFDFGVSSSGSGSGLAADMVTLGHYITPNLYFSVGQSVLGDGTVARLRYRITRNIEIQTESGTQDGANIFYRIDF
ncbi:translocation/assembly module TamB domain-containing protein [Acidithiobacillus sp. AMEEHan]|uniref:translocation/assembly module TamB domain-containing protein n=1 Tax=Acidithiobacillus sp. AMEEHan TaxID=2994951 RepID=UPI0027E576E5|nr:translocation/assembly module TamB domain-containing protein [Acidithiobacillus sp. AMEEHan]